ncbi:hypothetical protein [Peribacillus asahii]|uniref:hypothetical protein n=1 Tax=Peribacillus asahii TaxID=228899 RepID=UPI0020795330|nr:hypothetical protein [Peribacillus asahii]USK59636.1 hypothetical protein LIT37_21250 [Peribacillus asahii]
MKGNHSFHSFQDVERKEKLIENLIRFIANTQVKTVTNEAALANFERKLQLVEARCEALEQRLTELQN